MYVNARMYVPEYLHEYVSTYGKRILRTYAEEKLVFFFWGGGGNRYVCMYVCLDRQRPGGAGCGYVST